MITHIIYHIYGYKVGCTKDLVRRLDEYRYEGYTAEEVEILEKLHDKSDQEAGDIEWAWADKLGYRRGPHYSTSFVVGGSEAGRKGGYRTAELGLSGFKTMTYEFHSARSKQNGIRMAAEGNTPAFREDECPHCGLRSNYMILRRWHFDYCPKNPNRIGEPKKFLGHSLESRKKISDSVRKNWQDFRGRSTT
jgi:hypothetical protein